MAPTKTFIWLLAASLAVVPALTAPVQEITQDVADLASTGYAEIIARSADIQEITHHKPDYDDDDDDKDWKKHGYPHHHHHGHGHGHGDYPYHKYPPRSEETTAGFDPPHGRPDDHRHDGHGWVPPFQLPISSKGENSTTSSWFGFGSIAKYLQRPQPRWTWQPQSRVSIFKVVAYCFNLPLEERPSGRCYWQKVVKIRILTHCLFSLATWLRFCTNCFAEADTTVGVTVAMEIIQSEKFLSPRTKNTTALIPKVVIVLAKVKVIMVARINQSMLVFSESEGLRKCATNLHTWSQSTGKGNQRMMMTTIERETENSCSMTVQKHTNIQKWSSIE